MILKLIFAAHNLNNYCPLKTLGLVNLHFFVSFFFQSFNYITVVTVFQVQKTLKIFI